MRSGFIAGSLLLCASAAFAQSDRSTITGTISDPAGGVIANAPIVAKNVDTGIHYQAATTATGNYTIAELPVGQYELTVSVAGFKKYVRSGIAVEVSTAGLRKPVAEIYPAPAFVEGVLEAGAPIALSSDAHLPEQVGFGYDLALELLQTLGVRELAVFERRTRRLEPLGR